MKRYSRILAALSLSLFLGFPLFASASGRLAISPGEELELIPKSDIVAPEFSWEIFKEEEKIETLNEDFLSYVFESTGEYRIDLTAKNELGESEKTHIDVLVQEGGPTIIPDGTLIPQLTTLPSRDANGTIRVPVENPSVLFFAGESKGATEYRFDTDLSTDTNGDEDPKNDIENSSDPSFSTGALWGKTFSDTSHPISGKLTVVNAVGESKSLDFRIEFFSEISTEKKNATLSAQIATIPPANEKGEIILGDSENRIILFSGNSTGNIVQYRIDADLFVDSDEDGSSQNDIDNLEHNSFTTGEPFSIPLNRNKSEQIVRLTVVSEKGKGMRLDRKILFKNSTTSNDFSPRLLPKAKEVFVGKTIAFSLFGSPPGAQIEWDIGADGSIEHQGTETDMSFTFDNPGEIPLLIHINKEGFSEEIRDTISVREITTNETLANPPIADFSFQNTTGSSYAFQNLSRADSRLGNSAVSLDWDFGDGTTSTEENPTYEFTTTGSYPVSLKATDSAGNSAKKTVTIDAFSPEPSGENPSPDEATSPIPPPEESENSNISEDRSSISIPWLRIFLIFFGLALLGVIALLIVRKIQMPDLTFREILEEEKERWLGGGIIPSPSEPLSSPPKREAPQKKETEESTPEIKESSEEIFSEPEKPIEVQEIKEVAPLEQADAPAPKWLQKNEEETTLETEKNNDIPDWLSSTSPRDENTPGENAEKHSASAENTHSEKTAEDLNFSGEKLETKEEDHISEKTKEEIPEWLSSEPIEEKEETPEEPKSPKEDDTPEWLREDDKDNESETESKKEPLPEEDFSTEGISRNQEKILDNTISQDEEGVYSEEESSLSLPEEENPDASPEEVPEDLNTPKNEIGEEDNGGGDKIGDKDASEKASFLEKKDNSLVYPEEKTITTENKAPEEERTLSVKTVSGLQKEHKEAILKNIPEHENDGNEEKDEDFEKAISEENSPKNKEVFDSEEEEKDYYEEEMGTKKNESLEDVAPEESFEEKNTEEDFLEENPEERSDTKESPEAEKKQPLSQEESAQQEKVFSEEQKEEGAEMVSEEAGEEVFHIHHSHEEEAVEPTEEKEHPEKEVASHLENKQENLSLSQEKTPPLPDKEIDLDSESISGEVDLSFEDKKES